MGDVLSNVQLGSEWERLELKELKAEIESFKKEISRLDPDDWEEADRIEQLEIWIKDLSRKV